MTFLPRVWQSMLIIQTNRVSWMISTTLKKTCAFPLKIWCLDQCYQWVQSAAISWRSNKKKLTYLKVGHRGIKQLIKMLMNNVHENSVWGRPAETNPLSSNRTEKRDQQDYTKLWEQSTTPETAASFFFCAVQLIVKSLSTV